MAKDTTRQAVERAFAEVAATPSEPPRLVEEMELSTRSQNCLRSAKIKTVKQLVRNTESDLLRIRGLGRKSLREIVEILADSGLTLSTKQRTSPEIRRIIREIFGKES